MPSQQVLEAKSKQVEEVANLLKGYKAIGIASLQKVRAAQLQELKKKLSEKVCMKVIKNVLMKMAIEKLGKEELKKLEPYLEGANLFLLTNLNPFKLVILLEKGKVKIMAKAGDSAAFDVLIPEGNTGQPPGPIISHLNSVGLPTRIESGSVWVSKDTLVVKKGETISAMLASILSKLGVKSVEAGLSLKTVLDGDLVITKDQLHLDIDETKKNVEKSSNDAFSLSLSIAYPTSESTVPLLQLAHQTAVSLSLGAVVPTKDTIVDLIGKAQMEMLSLSSAIKEPS